MAACCFGVISRSLANTPGIGNHDGLHPSVVIAPGADEQGDVGARRRTVGTKTDAWAASTAKQGDMGGIRLAVDKGVAVGLVVAIAVDGDDPALLP